MHLRRRRSRGPDTASYHGGIVRTTFFLSIVILAGTGGEILVAHAIKQAARVQTVTRSAVIALLERAFRPAAMWLGIALQALAFFALLALLSWSELSFVVPATALSYVVGAAGSRLFRRGRLNLTRCAGELLVCLCVVVTGTTES